jgi:UDPglucose 6-dehydrogenase
MLKVAAGMGYDARIGRHFLDAGLGWGGSCFPKDVQALVYMAREKGLDPGILDQVMAVNYARRSNAVNTLGQMLGGLKGKTIGLSVWRSSPIQMICVMLRRSTSPPNCRPGC